MNLEKLKGGYPTKITKLKMLSYFMKNKCLCGNKKNPYHWDCLKCCKKRNPLRDNELADACGNHINKAINLLEGIQRERKTEI